MNLLPMVINNIIKAALIDSHSYMYLYQACAMEPPIRRHLHSATRKNFMKGQTCSVVCVMFGTMTECPLMGGGGGGNHIGTDAYACHTFQLEFKIIMCCRAA